MFHFNQCAKVPARGKRVYYGGGGGGLVEAEGKVMWEGAFGAVYVFDETSSEWSTIADGGELRATLAVCGGSLVHVGGWKDGVYIKKVMELRGGKWSHMPDMLVGCGRSCVLGVSEGGMVVMGGSGNGGDLSDVQVFDGKTHTWHRGPSLPQPCDAVSAVVHGDLIVMMGGEGLDRAVWCANIRDLTSTHTHDTQQSVWRKLPDVPYKQSSVCVADGVLLAIGGTDGHGPKKTSAIYAFDCVGLNWKHVGDMPFECSMVETLLLPGGELLVVDGASQQVLKITVKGLAKLFPIPPIPNKAAERRLYEEAMTKGYVETSVTKCLIFGAAGVGKTHLKHLLLKKDPPEQRVSTGLADNPVRAISLSLAGVSGQEEDDWFVVEDDQALLKVIGSTVRGTGILMETSMVEVVRTLPKINVPGDGAGAVHSDPTPADIHATIDTTQQSRTAAIEELIYHINHSSDKEKLFGVKWIQLIDSGGQRQYHDILPLFIQNPGVTVFVLNLSEELSHQPTIEYYGADGKPVGKAYGSSLSHKQILQHCLGAMRSQDAHPLIITVGTHRDAKHRCSESIKEKNQQLKALLDAGSFRVLYNGEDMKEVIFAVNGKTPQDEDKRVAKVLRQEILSLSPERIKMPIAWFGLEVLLRKSSQDGILSLVECQVCAKRLQIEGDAFSAALHHLVHHNVFLYYPEVLPQTVFCDPQVVLTKVTELVEYHHKLRDRPDKGVAAESSLVKFRDHGLLSLKLLRKFPKHYKEGLFTAQVLLQLLVSVGVIAKIRDDEYLMPALLSYLDSDQVSKYVQQSTSLIVKPTQGCIPSGLFCCLVAHLLSPTSPSPWKVCMDGDKPFCLHRNCITFELENTTEIVTLVDMFSYIVLHINEMSSEVCREVRESVHSGIKSACGILKYQGVHFKDAFMCAGTTCSSDPPHVAVVVSGKKWRCSIRRHLSGDLSKGQLMWFGEAGVTRCTTVPVSLDSEPSLPDLMKRVAAVIPRKYEMVGLQLGLTLDECKAIHPQHQCLEDYHHAFGEIFDIWRKRGSLPYTWRTLIGVLKSANIGEIQLSEQLTSWITQSQS